ncbi:hypothetical protein HU200_011884 [Digitaria exilis]|uniref:DUF1618 domain-containing protein n=1 Tax=Digitaria exilis TaxID=1010633 RepID=A0A835FGE8_9POAL|nr:hypothetical protein HU200_011884 [Digitaria exilis]
MSGGGWALLEPLVFRRDDDSSSPDESKAPIRATGTTTWGSTFRIAFSFGEPGGHISRLYAQLPAPAFPDRKAPNIRGDPPPSRPDSSRQPDTSIRGCSSLKALPQCTEPHLDYNRVRLPRRRRRPLPAGTTPHMLCVSRLGLWCGDKELVVAELALFKLSKVFADIYLLHCSDGGDELAWRRMEWEHMRVEFLSTNDPLLMPISSKSAGGITTPSSPLTNGCILLCDMSKLPNHHPTVSYIWFPLDKLPDSGTSCWASTSFFRAVSVVDHGRVLKFVNVTRHDGIHFAPLQPGTGFTITCHTLVVLDSGGMAWEEDYTVTSGELWEANSPDRLPRHILMFPQVDMDRPRVAHFLSIEFGIGYVKRNKKMWVVSIDMSTKTPAPPAGRALLTPTVVEVQRPTQPMSPFSQVATASKRRPRSLAPPPAVPSRAPHQLSFPARACVAAAAFLGLLAPLALEKLSVPANHLLTTCWGPELV